MQNLIIEKLALKDLQEALLIYDMNHNLKSNYQKALTNYKKMYNNPNYHNIVAKLDGKIVGSTTIIINYDIVEELKPFLTVWNFGVHKNYKRKNIGTKMMDYIYDFAKQNDCSFIALLAEKTNVPAQKFYENVGFNKEVGYVKIINMEKRD